MADSVSVSAATTADLPVLGDFLYSSKLALAINRLLVKDWPNEVSQTKNYSASIASSLVDPTMEGLKAVNVRSGQIVGFVVLGRKDPEKRIQPHGKEASVMERTAPDWMNSDLFEEVMQASAYLDRQSEAFDHFSVIYIFVAPSNRRQGIGSQLLHACREKAKAAGIPLVAVTEPEGFSFFQRAAFEVGDHYEFDLAKYAAPHSGFGPFRLTRMTWAV